MSPQVSVVIPTMNRRAQLLALIDSIAASDFSRDDMEIIVVDNGLALSSEVFEKHACGIRIFLYKTSENLFCSGSREFGLGHSKGHHIFFIDDDNVLHNQCITELVNALEQDTSLGVVGPLMLIKNNEDTVWCGGGKLNNFGLPIGLFSGENIKNIKPPPIIRDLDFLPNAFMVRREVFTKVKFSSQFPHNWSEPDFCLRAKKAGFDVASVMSAIEWHDVDYSGPLTRVYENTIYDQARSRILFRRIHLNSLKAWLLFSFIVFPASSAAYAKEIVRRHPGHRLNLLRKYLMGTFDGLREGTK